MAHNLWPHPEQMRPSTSSDDYPATIPGTTDWMRNLSFDLGRQRRDIELGFWKKRKRRERERALRTQTRSLDQTASNEAVATPTSDDSAAVAQVEKEQATAPQLANVYQAADESVSRDMLTPEQQAELDADRTKFGNILDTIAYLSGNTSRRSSFEKRVGSTAASRADRDKERQDYIDRAIGNLIMQYNPNDVGQLKTLMISAGITDVDDLKRAYELFEQYRPVAASAGADVLSEMAGNPDFIKQNPLLAEAITQSAGTMGFEEAQQFRGAVAAPQEGSAHFVDAIRIAEANWRALSDEDRSRIVNDGWSKDEWIRQRAAGLTTELRAKKEYATPQTQAEKDRDKRDTAEMLRGVYDTGPAAADAAADMARAKRALALLQSGVVDTGPTAPFKMSLKRWLLDLFSGGGAEQEGWLSQLNVANEEFVQSISHLYGLNFIQKTKGAISNAEMRLFMSIGPNLAKSRKGNELMLQMIINASERQMALYKVGEDFRKQHWGKPNAHKLWLGFLRSHPEMQRWLDFDEVGVGGIITRDMMDEADRISAERQAAQTDGVRPPNATYNEIGAIGGVDVSGRPDITRPFEISPGRWVIIKGGQLIQVQWTNQ